MHKLYRMCNLVELGRMVELADTLDLKFSDPSGREGSSPSSPTMTRIKE